MKGTRPAAGGFGPGIRSKHQAKALSALAALPDDAGAEAVSTALAHS